MSDIRFNQWLHNSGTGGVSQVDGGHVGIGTTNPLIPVGAGNTAILNVGVVTANSYYGNGSGLTALNASNIGSGTVPTARLGSGTASSSTFLRGDSTFAAVTSTTINNNADNRLITGSGTANTLEGESALTFDGNLLKLQVDSGEFRIEAANGVDAFTVDSDNGNSYIGGRLLLGTTTEGNIAADNLTVAGSGDEGITIRSGTSNSGNLFFSDGTSGGDEYRGYLQYQHSNNKLSIGTNTLTRLALDGDGRVLIGTNSDTRTTTLIISGNSSSGATGQAILNMDIGTTSISDGTSIGVFRFGATGDRRGADIKAEGAGTWSAGSSHPTDLIFSTNASGSASTPTERLRINSVGNMSLGNLDPVPTASYYNTACFHIHQTTNSTSVGSQIHLTTANKGSAAGDGSQVSQYNGSLYINNQDDGNTYFYNNGSATATIKSSNNCFGIGTQNPTDKLDVNGTAIIRSNLYLSNNVYLAASKGIYFDGNSGASHHLDDYEEGSWTPTISSGGSGISVSTATYTKVGRLVHVQCRYNSVSSPNGSQLKIAGLPFTAASTGHYTAAVMHDGWDFGGSQEPVPTLYMSANNAHFVFYYSRTAGQGWAAVSGSDTNGAAAIFSWCYHST